MHAELSLLQDIVVVFVIAIGVLFFCSRFKIPVIVGYLITGIVTGPSGLGVLTSSAEVDALAEIGVVLLLFTIGIEFSFKHLASIKRLVLVGGSLQVVLTTGLVMLVARLFDVDWGTAVLFGFLAALSSTAIVMKSLQESGEVDAPHGRLALGVLIFQDIVMAPMILSIPLLAGDGNMDLSSLPLILAKAAAVVLIVVLATRYAIPWLLFQITSTRSKELFLLTVLTICFGIAFLSVGLGLSLALGAFFAGLIISESEYSHQALGNILPFRDAFISFFFISIGMLLDLSELVDNAALVAILVIAVIAGKAIIAALVNLILAYPLRAALVAGLALAQIGEFSFVLSKVGMSAGLMTESAYQLFLSVSVISMALTPFIMALSPKVAGKLSGLPLLERLDRIDPELEQPPAVDDDHLLIIGYGENGRNLSAAAKAFHIPYSIVEMNPVTVRNERERGEPIFYGDASYSAVLETAGVRKARLLAIGIPDSAVTRRIVQEAKQLNPHLVVIARTQLTAETTPLFDLGADDVVPQEYETALEITRRVLGRFLVPQNDIIAFMREARKDRYEQFRHYEPSQAPICDWQQSLPGMIISNLRVEPGARIIGKTLAELDIRRRYKITVLAIHRHGEVVANPKADAAFEIDDIVVFMHRGEHFDEFGAYFAAPAA